MTNAEAAAHFAALPAEALAEVLLIEADTSSAENFTLDPPGTNLDEVEEEFLNEGDKNVVTIYRKW